MKPLKGKIAVVAGATRGGDAVLPLSLERQGQPYM